MAPDLAADAMLGRLARWMRLLGLDTLYLHNGPWPPLIGRVLLTRRTNRPHQRRLYGWDQVVMLTANDTFQQLDEAIRKLNLTRNDLRPLTRCSRCNQELTTAATGDVLCRVPLYVRIMNSDFAHCRCCGRLYWPGTHYERMMSLINNLPM